MSITREAARALLEIGAVTFTPDQPITFKSGMLSPVYVDNRRLPFYPSAWRVVVEGLAALIRQEAIAYDVIAGVAVGGIPHSAALAYTFGVPSIFIRKEAKGHGHGRRVEGGDITGRRVLLVEDMVTTGGSGLDAVGALRSDGGIAAGVVAVVSYGFAEARDAFHAADIPLHTLTNFDAILLEAAERGLPPAHQESVRIWLHDPWRWTHDEHYRQTQPPD